jgi:hypothetical protein
MLSLEEKRKIKDVLTQLNVREDINMAYFLNLIVKIDKEVSGLSEQIDRVLRTQKVLAEKLDALSQRIG